MNDRLKTIPIKLPGNPFWEVFKTFSKDEILAMAINVLGTFLVGLWIASGTLPEGTAVIVLSLAGPVIEKFGFFPLHFIEARSVYKSTPEKSRKKMSFYFGCAFKDGAKSLLEDVLIHDPVYIVLMLLGQNLYAQTPAWLLSFVSFVIAVFVVSGLEVGFYEFRYFLFKKKLIKHGAGMEKYLESRFFIDEGFDAEEIIAKVSEEFNLGNRQELDYYDKYYENTIPRFNERTVKSRFRSRTANGGNGKIESNQIVFTRVSEMTTTKDESYRFFPQYKEKLYFPLNSKTGGDFGQQYFSNKLVKSPLYSAKFKRIAVNNPATIYFAIDQIEQSCDEVNITVCEIKVWKDNRANLLKAMGFIMEHFPVRQTTHTKLDIISED